MRAFYFAQNMFVLQSNLVYCGINHFFTWISQELFCAGTLFRDTMDLLVAFVLVIVFFFYLFVICYTRIKRFGEHTVLLIRYF